jgi:ribose transport system substrate-binding protein
VINALVPPRRWPLAAAAAVSALALAGCGGGTSSAAASGSGGALVNQAKTAVSAAQTLQTAWTGPGSSPTPPRGANVIYVSSDQNNPFSSEFGTYFRQAAAKLGWHATVIDGKGTPSGWSDGLRQAIAAKPDAIVTSAQAPSVQQPLAQAAAAGIPVLGLHSAAVPGPDAADHLFTNITSDPAAAGKVMADWAIADSGGKAHVVIVGDDQYPVSNVKRDAMVAAIKACSGCTLEKNANVPVGTAATDLPVQLTSWLQTYPKPLYVLSVADFYFDVGLSSLKNLNVPKSQLRLAATDGTKQAYQRVRNGQYQLVTVPEPTELLAWQAADEVNRALNHQPPSTFTQPIYLVTKDNIDSQGGGNDQFFPQNDYKQHYESIWKLS